MSDRTNPLLRAAREVTFAGEVHPYADRWPMRPADESVRIRATASVSDALRQMMESDSGRLLVTDNGHIVGLITRTGITRFIQMKTELEEEQD